MFSACTLAEVQPLGPASWLGDAGVEPWDASRQDTGTPDSGVRDLGFRDIGPRDSGVPEEDILTRLRRIPGIQVDEVPASVPGTRAFLIRLRQPENHDNPARKSFEHRLVLIHRSTQAPMVALHSGYGLFGDPLQFTAYLMEPAVVLEANQLTLEHRFFGESIADNPDWQYLNIEQSARDVHRIYTLFNEIYRGPWIGTGASKGGMAAIFHHHFFPADMVGIVPYVAPLSFGPLDSRYQTFLDQIGPSDGRCRDRAKDMELEVIQRRQELGEYWVRNDPATVGYTAEQVGLVTVYLVLGFHWSFWQYLGSPEACAAQPPQGADIAELAAWFPFDIQTYLNAGLYDPELTPYSYQVSNELGHPEIDYYSHLEAALGQVDFSNAPAVQADLPPWGLEPAFDPAPLRAVDARLRTEARNILAIYGAWDPWTAGNINLNPDPSNLRLYAPQMNHGAQIADLTPQEQEPALRILFQWGGRGFLVEPDFSQIGAKVLADGGHKKIVELIRAQEQKAQLNWRASRR